MAVLALVDRSIAQQFIKADLAEREPDDESQREWCGDSAYGTADVREQIEAAGDTAVLIRSFLGFVTTYHDEGGPGGRV